MASSKILSTNRFSEVINCDSKRLVEIISDLPFKIKITNITVPGYSPIDVPPIGLAIVGINNYIL